MLTNLQASADDGNCNTSQPSAQVSFILRLLAPLPLPIKSCLGSQFYAYSLNSNVILIWRLFFVPAGEVSPADLPPESGGSEQQEQYDLSIDVFPRLHEKDPYRCAMNACFLYTKHH